MEKVTIVGYGCPGNKTGVKVVSGTND